MDVRQYNKYVQDDPHAGWSSHSNLHHIMFLELCSVWA